MKLYNWSERGKEDYIINQPRRKSLSVIAGVTDTEIIAYTVMTHTIKGTDFVAFLEEVIAKLEKMNKDQQKTFVLFYDNATCHKAKDVRTYLNQ